MNLLAVPFTLAVVMATKYSVYFANLGHVGWFFAWVVVLSYSFYMIDETLLTFPRSLFSGDVQSQQFRLVLVCMVASWLFFSAVEKRGLRLIKFVEGGF